MENIQHLNPSEEQIYLGPIEQKDSTNLLPVSSEIGSLWTSYLAETMSVCELKQYVAKTSEPEIRSILQRALDISSQRVQTMVSMFNLINHPVPIGFGEKDVDTNAKPLYNSSFRLAYTRIMHKIILASYVQAVSVARHPEFRNFFMGCIDSSQEIIQKTTDILVAKGVFFHSPYIETPQSLSIVDNNSYLGSIIGTERPINAVELGYLFSILEVKMFVRLLNISYSQVVRSDALRSYFVKAIQVANKQIRKLESIVENGDLPKPSMIEYTVTDSQEAPFSDKLMLSHVTVMVASILAKYGFAFNYTFRADLISTYRSFLDELIVLSKDGISLMIENGWLEKIPEAVNRKELLH